MCRHMACGALSEQAQGKGGKSVGRAQRHEGPPPPSRVLCWLRLRPGQLLALARISICSGALSLPGTPAAPRTPEAIISASSESPFFEGRRWVSVVTSPPLPPRSPTPGRRQRLLVLNHSFFHPKPARQPPGPGAAAEARVAEVRGFPPLLWLHSRALGGHLVEGLGAQDPSAW